jgi:predicted membrane channel-forming protein YqfA (hemolysin III family)
MPTHEDNHGKNPAAWTMVVLVLIGSLVSSIAVVFARPLFFWIGIAIVLAGGIVGLVLRSAGFGQETTSRHSGGH